MLGVRVPKLRYLDLDQLSIACITGLLGVRVPKLGVRVPKLRYLDQLSITCRTGLLGVRVLKLMYLDQLPRACCQ